MVWSVMNVVTPNFNAAHPDRRRPGETLRAGDVLAAIHREKGSSLVPAAQWSGGAVRRARRFTSASNTPAPSTAPPAIVHSEVSAPVRARARFDACADGFDVAGWLAPEP